MRITLITISLIGVFLFGSVLAMTFARPAFLESSAAGFIKHRIASEASERFDNSSLSSMVELSRGLADRFGLDTNAARKVVAGELADKVATIVVALCRYDCDRREGLSAMIAEEIEQSMVAFEAANARLVAFVKGRYTAILDNLMTDLRIFLGCNLLVFSALVLALMVRSRATPHLLVPASLLLVSTVVSSGFYLFGQDWFYTILYNDYMGYGFLVYIGGVFALLMDVVLNRARVLTRMVNAIAQSIGSAFSLVPC